MTTGGKAGTTMPLLSAMRVLGSSASKVFTMIPSASMSARPFSMVAVLKKFLGSSSGGGISEFGMGCRPGIWS